MCCLQSIRIKLEHRKNHTLCCTHCGSHAALGLHVLRVQTVICSFTLVRIS